METSISNSEFYILLSLALKSRHGYEIMQQVEQDSLGKVKLGPGTLYGAIKRMLIAEFIEELATPSTRRKYYKLTDKGRSALSAELERYSTMVDIAKRAKLFNLVDLNGLGI